MSEQHDTPYGGDTDGKTTPVTGWLTSRQIKLATCVLVSQLVMTAAGWGYLKATTPDVVVFDMKGTVDLFMQQSAQLQLDEDKAKAMTARFNAALTESLSAWEDAHNDIILVKPAVMSPQRDITNEIRADIARRTQGGQ